MTTEIKQTRLTKVKGKGTYVLLDNKDDTIVRVIHASNEGDALDQHESGTTVCHVYKNNGEHARAFLLRATEIKKANPHIKF